MRKLEKIFWRQHRCLLWQFFGGLKNGLFAELPFLTSWESICWLFFKPTLMALCLNAVSQFFIQAIIFSRSLWIQTHLDLGKPPSFIFVLDLLSHARVFVSTCMICRLRVRECQESSASPQALWLPTALGDRLLILCHWVSTKKSCPQPASRGRDAERGEDRTESQTPRSGRLSR